MNWEKGGSRLHSTYNGFSNVIVASAMEFKREGYILAWEPVFSVLPVLLLVFGFAVSTLIGLIKVLFM